MPLHPLFAPQLAQIEAKWPTLPAETQANLTAALPDLRERLAVLDWNARLSAHSPRFLEPCQALYAALMAWDGLSVMEKLAVTQAGIGPISQMAAKLGLVPGAKAVA